MTETEEVKTHWYSLHLGDAMMASVELDRALARLVALDPEETVPAFSRHESEGRLHCELVLYLPPSAAVLADALHASPCITPAYYGLSQVRGTEGALARLLPDGGNGR